MQRKYAAAVDAAAAAAAAAELTFGRKQKKILGTAQASWAKIQALLGLD